MAIELQGIRINEEDANGKFCFAEPIYGGSWTIFRTHENGRGLESLSAEIVDRERGTIRTAIFRFIEGNRRVPMNRLQAENALRRELGIL